MLSADEIKDRLSTEDVIRFMEYFGADIGLMTEEYITFTSICHGSNSHKFYYYPNTKSYHCYVCGSGTDIFTIAQQELNLTFNEAIEWVIDFFQLGKHKGFGRPKKVEHTPKIIKPKEINLNERLPSYSKSILNTFYDVSPIEWLREDISKNVMKLFGIKLDINTKSIIIPCKDMYNNLIGIRQRKLDEYAIENYGKYTVYTDLLSNIMYKFPSSKVLYGLYENFKKIQECKQVILFEGDFNEKKRIFKHPNK